MRAAGNEVDRRVVGRRRRRRRGARARQSGPTDVGTLQAIAAAGQSPADAQLGRALTPQGRGRPRSLLVPQRLHRPPPVPARPAHAHSPPRARGGADHQRERRHRVRRDPLRRQDRLVGARRPQHGGVWLLVLLTDLDGLYTADPRTNAEAELITRGEGRRPLLAISAGAGGSGRGSGGMASKLEVGPHPSWSGVPDGDRQRRAGPVCSSGPRRASRSHPFRGPQPSTQRPQAVDRVRGAGGGEHHGRRRRRRALVERKTSLLPAGVVRSKVAFPRWRHRRRPQRRRRARSPVGWCSSRSNQLRKVAGMQTRDLPDGVVHEVIHRDDLVLLPSESVSPSPARN